MATAATTTTEDPVLANDPEVSTLAGFPINRVVAFAGPLLAVVAGYIATFLAENLEFLHLDSTGTTGTITNWLTFTLTAVLVWVGQHKWLDGYAKWERTALAPALATVVDPDFGEPQPPVIEGENQPYDPAKAALPASGSPRGKAGE